MLDGNFEARRFHECDSQWLRSFSLDTIKCLVVCRGPVRSEAFSVFDELGVSGYGMLLSEKDSVVYPRCLAPELRGFRHSENVHHVPDYMGVGQEEKLARIDEIVDIALQHHYTHVFAGYGFMAEDAEFIAALEKAGVGFIGPSSRVVRMAGAKDEAKKLARSLGNAVIPGIDDVSARALVKRAGDRGALEALAERHELEFTWRDDLALEENAEALLQVGYAKTVELVTVDELQIAAEVVAREVWSDYPNNRIRFKHIGGGGGKGQRVVAKPEEVAAAVMDVLAEVKVLEPGTNRNFLIELNIESTRHNEIQLIGNGRWCVSLGGRDCSVQMHEQKLLEVSLTQEALEVEVAVAEGRSAEVLKGDMGTLQRMEMEAARFGAATSLDSVSTFECVVEGRNHFFMEMNTRIQVEHRVTELAYRLKFTNPDDDSEIFYVDRLIEAMALIALHGEALPEPERVPLNASALEVRINATNAALQPHAGGLVRAWSKPIPGEIRDDQGIGVRNPDTDSFVFYNLAGAYDSNIALMLTVGSTRRENLENMSEAIRRTELRGDDLQTNMPMHYGLVNWLLGKAAMAKPDTRFMTSYLAGVGALQSVVVDVDLGMAARALLARIEDPEAKKVFLSKQTLLLRPMERLLANPHWLAGFIGRFEGELWRVSDAEVKFAENPVRFLRELYHYLNMEETPHKPPSDKIWDHDDEVLRASLEFYAEVSKRSGVSDWDGLQDLFEGPNAAAVTEGCEDLWQACLAAHRGFQLGLELLLVIPRIGVTSGFNNISVNEELVPVFPAKFLDADTAAQLTRALAPLPKASSDEIVTPMGGAFFPREAPHLPMLVDEGDHFDEGQPLFIIEVMKMFNKVLAPFSGVVTKNLMAGKEGSIVTKGQPIFKIEPDERLEEETVETITTRGRTVTLALL